LSLTLLAIVALLGAALAGEDDIYLGGCEAVTVAGLKVARPDKEWVFIDVAKQRALAAKEKPAGEVEAEYGGLEARLYDATARALISIHAQRQEGEAPPAAKLEAGLRSHVASRKGAEIVQLGRTPLWKHEAVRVDYLCAVDRPAQRDVPGAAASVVYFYSRLDCARPGALVTFFFEVPKDRLAKARPGWEKLLKGVKDE